jgi:hypothetical protein
MGGLPVGCCWLQAGFTCSHLVYSVGVCLRGGFRLPRMNFGWNQKLCTSLFPWRFGIRWLSALKVLNILYWRAPAQGLVSVLFHATRGTRYSLCRSLLSEEGIFTLYGASLGICGYMPPNSSILSYLMEFFWSSNKQFMRKLYSE